MTKADLRKKTEGEIINLIISGVKGKNRNQDCADLFFSLAFMHKESLIKLCREAGII